MRKYWLYIGGMLLLVTASANDVQQDFGMHDPTKPADYSTPKQSQDSNHLELIMTFISGEGKIAIINGTTYEEGAVVDGFRITKIEQNKVHLHAITGQQSMVLVPKKNQLIRPVVGVSR